jgi:DNA-binding transcriptional LysR family regulator
VELRHLKYFVAVAEELSFSRAAARLRIAQPPLSQQIKALETELGAKLFHRTSRNVSLTAAGEQFLPDARQVLEKARQAEQKARQAGEGTAGELSIGFITTAANFWLANAIKTFREAYPGVRLSLRDQTPAHILRDLLNGTLDLGLTRRPVHEGKLTSEVVLQDNMVIALPENHRLAAKNKIYYRDLAGESFVMLRPELAPGYYEPFLARCAQAGVVPIVGQYAEEIHTKTWLVAAGFGIAPTSGSLDIIRKGVVCRSLAEGSPRHQMVAAWRAGDESPLARNFLRHIRTQVNRLGPVKAADQKLAEQP